ncbi:hydroxyethylthiazole kinase [Yoonia sp. 2307UL14-13]|uniref:hydroxyethylthiazole kinase n=1 Tax=Yoonia sp. 2307UL14-13 TaxID=3126506 RepID=UPI0030A4FF3E
MITPSDHLKAMQQASPLIQNISNYVAMNIMANVMLAAGASPAMVHAREEGADFTRIANGLSINIGTLDAEWADCMVQAAKAADERQKPWVLDPVAIGATAFRQNVAATLLEHQPTVIRGNASEILALSGAVAQGRGADSADQVAAAEDGACALARARDTVVAVTGPVDYVTDGHRAARIANGHPLMPKVTALGCALTGLVAAFAATNDPFKGTLTALAYYGLAGERAAETATGPGSFQPAFLDALHNISGTELDAGARILPA